MVIQGVNYPSDFEAKKLMTELAKRMAAQKYAIAGDGSLSVRVGPNAVWVTEQGADKGTLTQDQFLRVDMNGKQMMSAHPRPLPEDITIHLKVYRENEMLRCILHGYPIKVVGMVLRGQSISPEAYSPAVRALGRISLLGEDSPEGQATAAALAAKTDNGVLLGGDGCMVWGKSPAEAFQKMEALDYYAAVRAELGEKQLPIGTPPNSVFTCSPVQTSAAVPAAPVQLPVTQEVEGLTPLIRPGVGGFCLPTGSVEQQRTAPQPAAYPQQQPLPMQPAAPAAAAPPPAVPGVTNVPRAQVMAEVIRRTMIQMK